MEGRKFNPAIALKVNISSHPWTDIKLESQDKFPLSKSDNTFCLSSPLSAGQARKAKKYPVHHVNPVKYLSLDPITHFYAFAVFIPDFHMEVFKETIFTGHIKILTMIGFSQWIVSPSFHDTIHWSQILIELR